VDAVCEIIERNLREVNRKDYSQECVETLVQAHDQATMLNRAKEAHLYVACEGDTVMGCGAIEPYLGSPKESILRSIFVLPEFHGRGIGREIVMTLEGDEFYRRARRMEVHASLTAYDFYRKLGYADKGGVRKVEDGCIPMEKFPAP
jgi:GNAT superfamily N-acetyltransferase